MEIDVCLIARPIYLHLCKQVEVLFFGVCMTDRFFLFVGYIYINRKKGEENS